MPATIRAASRVTPPTCNPTSMPPTTNSATAPEAMASMLTARASGVGNADPGERGHGAERDGDDQRVAGQPPDEATRTAGEFLPPWRPLSANASASGMTTTFSTTIVSATATAARGPTNNRATG